MRVQSRKMNVLCWSSIARISWETYGRGQVKEWLDSYLLDKQLGIVDLYFVAATPEAFWSCGLSFLSCIKYHMRVEPQRLKRFSNQDSTVASEDLFSTALELWLFPDNLTKTHHYRTEIGVWEGRIYMSAPLQDDPNLKASLQQRSKAPYQDH